MTRELALREKLALALTTLLAIVGFWISTSAMITLLALMTSVSAVITSVICLYRISRSFSSAFHWPMEVVATLLLCLILLSLFGTVLYHLKFGKLPNSEIIRFIIYNLDMIPAHILQTAPLMTISALSISLVSSIFLKWLLNRSQANRSNQTTSTPVVVLLSSLALLGASILLYPDTGHSSAKTLKSPKVTYYLESLPPVKPANTNIMNHGFPVIVILAESLRHDLLTEHARDIPFLSKLSLEGITFDRAYATASHSNLTDLAFWYAQYPLRGAGKETYPMDAPWRGTSLFGAFKQAGYNTAYISSQNEHWGEMVNWLKTPDVNNFFHSEDYKGSTWENMDDEAGLASLIRKGISTAGKIEDSQTLKLASEWIFTQPSNTPFFLGMNLQNTHYSYVIPSGGKEPHQPSKIGFQAIYYSWPQDQAPVVKNRYLNAVINLDNLLNQFSETLKQRGLWDECLLVVLGDNGEGFYEHNFGNHSGPCMMKQSAPWQSLSRRNHCESLQRRLLNQSAT